MISAKLLFRPEKELGVFAKFFSAVKQFFVEFEQAGLRGFIGGGVVEQCGKVGCRLHGFPVGSESVARMQHGAFFSWMKGVGAFGKIEQFAGGEKFVFAEKGAFRPQGAFE